MRKMASFQTYTINIPTVDMILQVLDCGGTPGRFLGWICDRVDDDDGQVWKSSSCDREHVPSLVFDGSDIVPETAIV
jgi:hypothetical protein